MDIGSQGVGKQVFLGPRQGRKQDKAEGEVGLDCGPHKGLSSPYQEPWSWEDFKVVSN